MWNSKLLVELLHDYISVDILLGQLHHHSTFLRTFPSHPTSPTHSQHINPSFNMVAITSITLSAATLISLTTAIPAQPVRYTGVIHRVFAGSTTANNGLHFEPENVVAEPGDLMEFHFLPKAHTFVQSSFDKPCEPLGGDNAIFSGFNFNTTAGEAPNVFTFMVPDKNPIWYYCSQPNGNHCQKGMSGVINQNFNSNKTLAKYKDNAVNTVTKQPSTDPLASQVGMILPNVPI